MSRRSSRNLSAGRNQSANPTFYGDRPKCADRLTRRMLRQAGRWPAAGSDGEPTATRKNVREALAAHRKAVEEERRARGKESA